MKNIITILLLFGFIGNNLESNVSTPKNYYVSTSGSDSNDGLTPGSPWQTIAKVNSSFASVNADDSILFKCGDTFYGTVTIVKSGTAGHPIVISSYGSGAKPVITGFTTISGWTNDGSGIYSKVISYAAQTNMVAINGTQQAMGRFPDAGYLSYESFSTNTSITDNTLRTATNWTGAEAVIRKNDWTIDRTQITDHAANTLTYTSKGSTLAPIAVNFGYFIQNDLRTLTTYGEWYHNAGTGKFSMFFGAVDPATKSVQVATLNNLVSNAGSDYITIDNLDFSGSIDNAINFSSSTDYCTVQNSNVSFAGKGGIYILGGTNSVVTNNNLRRINGVAISSDGTNTIIANNGLSDIGLLVGQVIGNGGCNGIYSPGNNVVIRNNNLKRIAATGIVLKYSGAATVQNNLVDSACMVFDDGGGIYLTGPDANIRLIDHNIIINTVGNSSGTQDTIPLSTGIYLDEQSTNVTVSNNTCANINYAGIKLHKAHEDIVTGNVFYNNKYGIGFFNDGGSLIRNIVLNGNISVAKTATQQVLRHQSSANDVALFGTADSNIYARPIDDNLTMSINQPSLGNVAKSLSTWQAFTSQDPHSKKSPKTISNVNNLLFAYNASDTASVVSFPGSSYVDLKGDTVNNAAIIPKRGSRVFIYNGAAPTSNMPPVAQAGADKYITLPTDTTTLNGSATDSDGTITSYQWKFGATVIATSASVSLTGLTPGKFTFTLTVTDNNGATGRDTVDVTVSLAPTSQSFLLHGYKFF